MFYTAHYNLKDEDNEIEEEEIDAALKKVLILLSVGNHFFQTETITRQDEKELAMFGE
jgi:hypothetical protein